MKKKLARTAALIGLLFLIFFSWLKYREYRSFQIPVHKGATKLIKINVDGIYKTLALDFIGSPFYYLKQDKNKDGEKTKKQENGLKMPANIVLYSLNGANETYFWGYLRISNHSAFKQFIKQKFDIPFFEEKTKGILLGASKNGRFNCAFTQKEVAFVFSLNRVSKQTDRKLIDLLERKNCLSTGNPLLQKLKQAEGHLALVQKNGNAQVIFGDGNIMLNAVFPGDSIIVPEKTKHRIFDKNSSIKAWLDADISRLLKPRTFSLKNKSHFHMDSLLRYTSDYMDLEVRNSVWQQDSIISFSYNDNFEKIAAKTIAKKEVPEIYISTKTKGPQLSNYLKRQGILDEKLKLNKQIFPLYHVYGTNSDSILQLSTARSSTISSKQTLSDQFLYLNINFQQLKKQHFFPILEKYISFADSLTLSAQKPIGKPVELNGSIYFSDQNINGLYQLTTQLP